MLGISHAIPSYGQPKHCKKFTCLVERQWFKKKTYHRVLNEACSRQEETIWVKIRTRVKSIRLFKKY